MRASLRTLPPGERHTLAHDADRYLDKVQSTLASFADRRRDLLAWLPRFGHLRTLALPSHLAEFNVLYGRRASVELIDLARFALAPSKPRWIDRRHIAEVLSHLMSGSLTRVRLELSAHAGRPHGSSPSLMHVMASGIAAHSSG